MDTRSKLQFLNYKDKISHDELLSWMPFHWTKLKCIRGLLSRGWNGIKYGKDVGTIFWKGNFFLGVSGGWLVGW